MAFAGQKATWLALALAARLGLSDEVLNITRDVAPKYTKSGTAPEGTQISLGGVTWDYVQSHDCFGHNLANTSVIGWGDDGAHADRESCAKQCAEMKSCVAFNYPVLTNGAWDSAKRGPRVCYFKFGYVISRKLEVLCSSEIDSVSWDYFSLLPAEAKAKLEGPSPDEPGCPSNGQFDGIWTNQKYPGAELYHITNCWVEWGDEKAKILEENAHGLATGAKESEASTAQDKAGQKKGYLASAHHLDNGAGLELVWNTGTVWVQYHPTKTAPPTPAPKPAEKEEETKATTEETKATTEDDNDNDADEKEEETKATTEETKTTPEDDSDNDADEKEPSPTPAPKGDDEGEGFAVMSGIWTNQDNPGAELYYMNHSWCYYNNGTAAKLSMDLPHFTLKQTGEGGAEIGGKKIDDDKLELMDGSIWVKYVPPLDLFEHKKGEGMDADIDVPSDPAAGGSVDSMDIDVQRHEGIPQQCLQYNVTYEPLDMTGQSLTVEPDIMACKMRCMRTTECAHFAFWTPMNHCHIQSVYAVLTTNRYLFVSGAVGCKISGGRNLNTSMIVQQNNACFKNTSAMSPMDSNQYAKGALNRTQFSSVLSCQDFCAQHEWCKHFTYNALVKTCHLADKDAKVLEGIAYSVSGPAVCPAIGTFSFTLNNFSYTRLIEKAEDLGLQSAIGYGLAHLQRLVESNSTKTEAELKKEMESSSHIEPLVAATIKLSGNKTTTKVVVSHKFPSQSVATAVQNILLRKRGWMQYAVLMSIKARFDGSEQIALGVVGMSDLTSLELSSNEDKFHLRNFLTALVKKDEEPEQQHQQLPVGMSLFKRMQTTIFLGCVVGAIAAFAWWSRRGHTMRHHRRTSARSCAVPTEDVEHAYSAPGAAGLLE